MNEINIPTQSKATLIKASIAAILISLVIFFSIILPAEYNRDPTGIGSLLGLTVLSAPTSTETANSGENEILETTKKESGGEEQIDQIDIIIPAGRGLEYKFKMQQYAKLNFEWSTDAEPLYFDFHGEPEGDTTGYFESYSIATASQAKGTVTLPFNGVHGWYWKNETNKDVVVTLKTSGVYRVIGQPH